MGMSFNDSLAFTLNGSLLAILYTFIGAFISYLFYFLFDEFTEDWKQKSELFKIADICVELIVIANIGFWSSQLIECLPPVFPISHSMNVLINGYSSGIFFTFAMFIFLNDLTEKIKYMNDQYLEKHLTRYLPQHGSIIDLSLSYTPKNKTDS